MQDNDREFSFLHELQNRYHLLRHGHSEGNQQDIIVSDPERGVREIGLTDLGVAQVTQTWERSQSELADVTHIFTSDFLRTRQTAAIIAKKLSIEAEETALLRERFFGKWDGQASSHYEEVWKQDSISPGKTVDAVESVVAVARRTTGLVRQLEKQFNGQHILLVSHGDPLQVLLTAICGRDLHRHRDMPLFETAELRLLAESSCEFP